MWFMRSFRNAVPQPPGHQGLLPLVAFLLAALLASALVCLGSYGLQRRALEQQAKEELSYLALAQRNHLESMLDRCLAQAEVAAGEPFLVSRLQALSRPGAGRDPALEARLQAIQDGYGLRSIRFLDREARTLATTDLDPITGEERRLALAMTAGAPARLVWNLSGPEETMAQVSCLVPVRSGDSARPAGTLVFHLDFQTMLVSILHNQPTFRASGETMLVCRVGSRMVFLSRPRLGGAPVSGADLGDRQVGVQAFLAGEGFAEGPDHRGVPSIAASRKLAALPWSLYSQMDRAEVTAPLAHQAWIYGGVTALFLVMAGALIHSWWRRNQAQQQASWEHIQRENDQLDQQLRAAAEEALRVSEESLSVIFQESPVALAVTDFGTGSFCKINAALLQMLRADSAQLLGRTTLETGMIGAEERRQLQARIGERGALQQVQVGLRRLDGEAFTAELSMKAYEMRGTRYLLTSFTDITERVQASQERDRLQGQLTQAQKMESIGLLAGGLAHDFNNMLGVILANTDLALARHGADGAFSRIFQTIQTAAQRSAELTRQLLGFARKQTIAPKVVDLNEVVEGMLKMLRRIIGEDIDIAWMPGRNLWKIRIDPAQVDQILANLLVNARDAIKGEGKVTIDTQNLAAGEGYCALHPEIRPGDYLLVSVGDNGCGMDPATQARIFEPFFTTKGVGQGTGLGLATVYGVVKQNQGYVYVESQPGQGTTFRILLPRHAGPEVPGEAPGAPVRLPGGTQTVLLVEDNEVLLESYESLLLSLGYRVLAASHPREAIRRVEQTAGDIQLLLTDIVMPEMNGWDLARTLKEGRPGLKCLFMSGYPDKIVDARGVLEEELQFLQKPFSYATLALKLQEVLGAT